MALPSGSVRLARELSEALELQPRRAPARQASQLDGAEPELSVEASEARAAAAGQRGPSDTLDSELQVEASDAPPSRQPRGRSDALEPELSKSKRGKRTCDSLKMFTIK